MVGGCSSQIYKVEYQAKMIWLRHESNFGITTNTSAESLEIATSSVRIVA